MLTRLLAPVVQSVRYGAQINVFKLAAYGHATRQAGNSQATRLELLAYDVCCHFAIGGKVGGKDDFLHRAIAHALQQAAYADVAHAYAIERVEFAHQHKVQPFVCQCAFYGRLVCGGFNDAELAAVAAGVLAGGADFLLGKGVAQAAMAYRLHGVGERLRELACGLGVVLQQVVGHARSRLDAYAGQAAQGINQVVKGVGLGHSAAWWASGLERHFHASRHELGHAAFAGFFNFAHGSVKGSGNQVFKHVFVISQQAGVYFDALDIVFASHRYFDQACARFGGDFDIGKLVLCFFHLVLHGLGLLHQAR